MPSAAPATRGILRRSSYGSTDRDHNEVDSIDLDTISVGIGDLSLASPVATRIEVQNGSDSPPPMGSGIPRKVSYEDTRQCATDEEKAPKPSTQLPYRARKAPQRHAPPRSISFSKEMEETIIIPIIPRSRSGDFFYDDEEIAAFRHEKFMEDAGLDPLTYEPLPMW
ncbi:hypothetical protein IV203_019028 [Nitzschia inconspicua]|uniref:Uncharacterized protein n=1 Tax=Nitzschia inconspicua TaxID=303405 RepID=A0A9K3LYN9_9STRA|nr:hypothetical protein IV203_022648 [Nitzschia inconspicua]KAG7370458.1 hypothetical protein IV203_019028 [Nitzschia inconspicua]